MNNLELHSAGATVRNICPFEKLESYSYKEEMTQSFREEWVIPFYFEFNNQSEEWIEKMINLKPKITEDIVAQNLGDFNWRTRSTGSYFAAIKEFYQYEDIIGTHLLKSEVCYAGSQYAKTLAFYNTKKSIDYLSQYLEYYLKRPDLFFDQEDVIKALKYLDGINNTNKTDLHLNDWNNLLLWRYEERISRLNKLKENFPHKANQFEDEIQNLKPENPKIETTYFNESIKSLRKIAHG